MRKFIFFTVILSMVGALFFSCSGRNAEREREDSIRRADSIAGALKAEEESRLAAEQARMDSLRQDSIRQMEEAIAAIPTFKEITNSKDLTKMFKNKGFTVTKKTEYVDKYDESFTFITAIYDPGNGIYCKFVEDPYGYDYTIKGAPELLDNFQADAKAWIKKEIKKDPNDPWLERMYANKEGDTITMFFGGD